MTWLAPSSNRSSIITRFRMEWLLNGIDRALAICSKYFGLRGTLWLRGTGNKMDVF